MERIALAMMNLIAGEVCGKTVNSSEYVLSDEELADLYRLSKSHDLAHLVGDALIKNELIPKDGIRAKFEKQIILSVYRYERIHHELMRVKAAFSEAEIPFLPLKGSVIRQYYPEPWMRTSCDIDILVPERSLGRAAAVLTAKLSYREDEKGSHDIGFFSESGVHLELHYSLMEEKRIGTAEKVLQSVWNSVSPVAGSTEYMLSDEMYYYYHIAHMAKHFADGGCGVRPFLDIWILNHRVPYDREKRNALLKKGGLSAFAKEAENLSEVWFGDAGYTGISGQMEQYLLGGGVYGNTENRVAVQQVRKGGKFRYALSRIWLPYDVLKFHYPSLEGKRFLLPVYEMRRWGKLLFRGGAGRSVKELKLNSATTGEEQIQTREMLRKLGLDR